MSSVFRTVIPRGPWEWGGNWDSGCRLQTVDGSALTLKWDALNRLREAYRRSDSALVAVYLYDAGGRRVRKTVSNGGVDDDSSLNGVTDFYYSGWRVLEEREPDLGEEPTA